MSTTLPLDVGSRVAPVGLRFWDDVTRSFVGDGLIVTAQPAGFVVPPAALVPNASGVYYARTIFGFPASGIGQGDDAYWASLVVRPFVIQVDDAAGRFSSFSFTASLPARGIVGWTCANVAQLPGHVLPGNPPSSSVPLFSAPTRRPGGGLAVVRATLWDGNLNAPAAFAALGLKVDPALPVVWSIADALGRVVLVFAYPEPPTPGMGGASSSSSAGAGSSSSAGAGLGFAGGTSTTPLSQQTWTLPIQVLYAPGSVGPTYPDLCATFEQAAAHLWEDQAMTVPKTSITIQYGVELVMRSTPTAGPGPFSFVMVTPA